jgi:hypothetical protein
MLINDVEIGDHKELGVFGLSRRKPSFNLTFIGWQQAVVEHLKRLLGSRLFESPVAKSQNRQY